MYKHTGTGLLVLLLTGLIFVATLLTAKMQAQCYANPTFNSSASAF